MDNSIDGSITFDEDTGEMTVEKSDIVRVACPLDLLKKEQYDSLCEAQKREYLSNYMDWAMFTHSGVVENISSESLLALLTSNDYYPLKDMI